MAGQKSTREVGSENEKRAAAYLKKQGYRILEMNFYCRGAELDIVAEDDGYLCFIEVKYRSDDSLGYPSEAVTVQKIRRISKAALAYMNMKKLSEETPCRFDVVSVYDDRIELIKNAFDFYEGY